VTGAENMNLESRKAGKPEEVGRHFQLSRFTIHRPIFGFVTRDEDESAVRLAFRLLRFVFCGKNSAVIHL
jgi:hypothetical protein